MRSVALRTAHHCAGFFHCHDKSSRIYTKLITFLRTGAPLVAGARTAGCTVRARAALQLDGPQQGEGVEQGAGRCGVP